VDIPIRHCPTIALYVAMTNFVQLAWMRIELGNNQSVRLIIVPINKNEYNCFCKNYCLGRGPNTGSRSNSAVIVIVPPRFSVSFPHSRPLPPNAYNDIRPRRR
jgi:hypothetical protein